jgi:hypothetical protein
VRKSVLGEDMKKYKLGLLGLATAFLLMISLIVPPTAQNTAVAASSKCSSRQAGLVGAARAIGDDVWVINFSSLCKRTCPEILSLYVFMPERYDWIKTNVYSEYISCVLANPGSIDGGSKCKKTSQFSNIPVPRIIGSATSGKVLTVSTPAWKPSGTTLKYTWYKNGTKIAGETKKTLAVSSNLVGSKIRVSVSGSKTCYKTVSKLSAFTTVVRAGVGRTYLPSELYLSLETYSVLNGTVIIREKKDGVAPLVENAKWSVTGTSNVPWGGDVRFELPVEWYWDGPGKNWKDVGCLHGQTWNVSVTFRVRDIYTDLVSPPVTARDTISCNVPSPYLPVNPNNTTVVAYENLNR